ncbi:DUF2919 family protein [Salmonella enterica subsp. enterica]|nr:DUF2919 family protein [Salmonella enterica subsp. enterica]
MMYTDVYLPFLFWCVLLPGARARVPFVIAGSSRGQGNTLLNFLSRP